MKILVLGGYNLIGRQIVAQLSHSAHSVRVADAALAFGEDLAAKYSYQSVEVVECNLYSHEGRIKAFGPGGWDVVINAASDMKLGQIKQVYEMRVVEMGLDVARLTVETKCGVLIHVSTAMVYKDTGKLCSEKSAIKPNIPWSEAHAHTDKQLMAMEGLNLVILRPGIVYGPGDTLFVAHLVVCGRIYQELHTIMREIHRSDRRIHTIHVRDLARACIHAAEWYLSSNQTGQKHIFNIVDTAETTLGKLNAVIADMFGIVVKYHWWTVTKSSIMPKKYIEAALDDANAMHLLPWTRLLEASKIAHSPLTPYLDVEYFYGYEVVVDGSKFRQETGFQLQVPEPTRSVLEEALEEWKELKLWPTVTLPESS